MSTEKLQLKNLLLKSLLGGGSLTAEQIESLFTSFFSTDSDAATDAQIGAFLFGLSTRLPHADEILGGAKAMRKHMVPLPIPATINKPLLDTCGTGGSGLNSINTSTLVAFVAAAAGVAVVKHGNRSSTSACGSADLLEALGIRIDHTPENAAHCLEHTGFCFCFAPLYHQATKRVQLIRKELGFRTIFNFLGPLANPAQVSHQVLGVSSREILADVARALHELGIKRALVVCGRDGLDEITVSETTDAIEVKDGTLTRLKITPESLGLPRYALSGILGGDRAENVAAAQAILHGEKGPQYDLVLANAGAALFVVGKAATLAEGVAQADRLLQTGAVAAKVEEIQRWNAAA